MACRFSGNDRTESLPTAKRYNHLPPQVRRSYFLIGRQPGDRTQTADSEGEQVAAWVRHLIKMAKEPAKGNRADDSLVFVVDDDLSVRQAIKSLLQSVGLQVEDFGSAAELLKDRRLADRSAAACLVLDVRLPGVSGLDVQAELSNAAIGVPIIFITGHGDIPMTVRAIRAGAVEFLTKPFRDQDLIDAVQTALGRDRERRNLEMNVLDMRARFATLSPREKEVFSLVTAGLMNKQIAAELGLSEVTIKLHRGNVTKKMGARSLAELVRMADAVDIRQSKPQRS